MAKEKSSIQPQELAPSCNSKPKTRVQHLRAVNGPDVSGAKDINECAEDFINRFRQNLRLQRLQSIENYKQMLDRGL